MTKYALEFKDETFSQFYKGNPHFKHFDQLSAHEFEGQRQKAL
jgi:hypothetical protein